MESKEAQLLLEAIKKTQDGLHKRQAPFIHVSEAISTAASLYEKARNLVDFKAEHLLRKTAIQRILSRRIKFLKQRETLAVDITRELIRARYLPNDGVPEAIYGEIDAVLQKYLAVIDLIQGDRLVFDEQASWVLDLCAVELEELFEPAFVDHAIVQMAYDSVRPHVEVPGLDEETKDFQLYIAAYLTLTKSDRAMTEFHLLKLYMPDWEGASATISEQTVHEILRARDAINEQLSHRAAKRLQAQMRKVASPFIILSGLARERGPELAELLHNPAELEKVLNEYVQKRYALSSNRLWRRGVRALIYVFFTKILVGLLLELPYDYYIMKHVAYMPLLVNLLFPPILLFMILVSLRSPSKQNTNILIQALKEILLPNVDRKVFAGLKRIKIRRQAGFAFWLYSFFYLMLFIFAFGAIAASLRQIGFNAVSTALFILFTSIISFFGVSLRQAAKELIIIPGRENLITTIFNVLTLPILTAGRWVSENVNRINIFIFIFDVIIEAPFQFLMEAIESWLDFIREKKEEI